VTQFLPVPKSRRNCPRLPHKPPRLLKVREKREKRPDIGTRLKALFSREYGQRGEVMA
jgi:hypothetical protein